jgi:hypothetical protein
VRPVGQPDGGDGRAPGRGGPDRPAAQDDGCEQGGQKLDRRTDSEQKAGQDGTPARGSPDGPDRDAAGHVLLDGTVAKLIKQAADGLNTAFGVSLFKKDVPVGTVHLTAAG